MSRARNIKPGFFKNEVLVGLPFEYRLLFIGLWTVADRDGRFEDRPVRIKMEIFPGDNVDVDAGLSSLESGGFIKRYVVDGVKYCQIIAWGKHQNPHIKEAQSNIPPPCEHGSSTVQAPCEHNTSPADSLIPDSLQELSTSLRSVDVGIEDSSPPQVNGFEKPKANPVPYEQIVNLYHESLPMCPRVYKLTKTRKGLLSARWKEDLTNLDEWKNFFDFVGKSKFLTGKATPQPNKPPFIANLEWLTSPGNFAKIAEENYHRG